MDILQQFLQVSAKLYQHLTVIPNDDDRTGYIDMIHQLLDERSQIIVELQANNFEYNHSIKAHQTLFELDKGIRNRLEVVLTSVQEDLKSLQNSKKNEKQYINPYASVQVMDGRYYDQKK